MPPRSKNNNVFFPRKIFLDNYGTILSTSIRQIAYNLAFMAKICLKFVVNYLTHWLLVAIYKLTRDQLNLLGNDITS